MPHVTLYQEKVARLKSIVTATIDDSGALLVEGYDIGQLVDTYWGNSDYEYSMKVALKDVKKMEQRLNINKDEDLLMKIQQEFGGAMAFSRLKDFLDQQGIEYEFFSWT